MAHLIVSLNSDRCFRAEWPWEISADECEEIIECVELLKRTLPRFVKYPALPPNGGETKEGLTGTVNSTSPDLEKEKGGAK